MCAAKTCLLISLLFSFRKKDFWMGPRQFFFSNVGFAHCQHYWLIDVNQCWSKVHQHWSMFIQAHGYSTLIEWLGRNLKIEAHLRSKAIEEHWLTLINQQCWQCRALPASPSFGMTMKKIRKDMFLRHPTQLWPSTDLLLSTASCWDNARVSKKTANYKALLNNRPLQAIYTSIMLLPTGEISTLNAILKVKVP